MFELETTLGLRYISQVSNWHPMPKEVLEIVIMLLLMNQFEITKL